MTIPVTVRTDVGYEYHLDLSPEDVARILDPNTPDSFIEIPCKLYGMRRFLQTSYIKEIDVGRQYTTTTS